MCPIIREEHNDWFTEPQFSVIWASWVAFFFFFQFNQSRNLRVILDYFLQFTAVFLALPAEDIQNPTTSHHLLVFLYSEPTVALPHDLFSPPTDLPASNLTPHGLFPTRQLEQLLPWVVHVHLLSRPFSGSPFHERSITKVRRQSLSASTIPTLAAVLLSPTAPAPTIPVLIPCPPVNLSKVGVFPLLECSSFRQLLS